MSLSPLSTIPGRSCGRGSSDGPAQARASFAPPERTPTGASLRRTSQTPTAARPRRRPSGPILELRGLEKRYTGTHALKPADLAFEAGEIHAIVGENGAGKSTLIKLLTGVTPRTAGDIVWKGQTTDLSTPNEAIALGINAVHQEVVLCPHLSVAANIFLGDEDTALRPAAQRAMVRDAQKILDDLGFELPAAVPLSSLTIGQQQLIATARAATRGTQFLIFDEPTAYLTRQEAAQLFALIRRLKREGVTIVYISHRMEEIFELADRVSVLRDGTLVGTRQVGETNETELIALMINRSIEQVYHKETFPIGAPILETRHLRPRLLGRLADRARGRDRRPLRPHRRRAQRVRDGRLRPRPARRGEIAVAGPPGRHPQRARRHRPRHRARAREPARPGAVPQPRRRPQHQSAPSSTA